MLFHLLPSAVKALQDNSDNNILLMDTLADDLTYYIYCEAESLGKWKIGRSEDGGDDAEWEDEWQLLTSKKLLVWYSYSGGDSFPR